MDLLLKLYELGKSNLPEIISGVAHLVLLGSVIVKLTPTVKDDNYFKPLIRFIGKYIALDKYGTPK